jgi:hypothetical protein
VQTKKEEGKGKVGRMGIFGWKFRPKFSFFWQQTARGINLTAHQASRN